MSSSDSEHLFDELSAVNNEVVDARRELVRTNERLSRSMEELRLRQEWITGSIDTLPEAVFATDSSWLVSYVNESAAGLMGLPRGEMIGKDLRELIVLQDGSGSPVDLSCLVEEEPRTNVELSISAGIRLQNRSGSQVPVAGTVTSIHDSQGERTALILLLRNTTEVVRFFYESLGQSRREAAETIAAALLHDLNNLLMIVLANAEAARTQLSKKDEKVMRSLANIEHAGKRAEEFIRSVLTATISSLDRRAEVNVAEVIRRSAEAFLLQHPATKVLIAMSETPSPIFGNGDALAEALGKLLENAAEAMNDSGTITLAVQTVGPEAVRSRGSAATVRIQVSDTGSGMSPEVRERAFDPFYSTKALGRGLGLSVTRGIVRGHGGSLRLDPNVEGGTGTTATIDLPVEQAPLLSKE